MKAMLFVLLIVILMVSNAAFSGKIYKCKTEAGATTFQSKPCANRKQQTKISYQSSNKTPAEQCKIQCDANYRVCIAGQNGGYRNSDGGIQLCRNEKQVCYIGCVDPKKARQLSKTTANMRSDYDQSKVRPARNQRNTTTARAPSQACNPITYDQARKLAVKEAGYFKYKHLSKHQKERVDVIMKKYIANACASTLSQIKKPDPVYNYEDERKANQEIRDTMRREKNLRKSGVMGREANYKRARKDCQINPDANCW